MPTSYFNDYPNAPTTPVGGLGGMLPNEGSGSAYGSVPTVPSPGTTSIDALLANINNLGNIGQLGSTLTAQGSANAMQPLTAALPGLSGALGQGMGNAQSLLKGQIPADVLQQMQTQAAERGVLTGQGAGSPNTNAAYLRALGLTSLGLENQGLSNLTGLMGAIPKGPQFNPQSMLLDPNTQQMWQYLANVLRAAPSPYQAAQTNLGAFNRGLGQGSMTNTNPLAGMFGGSSMGTTEPSWQQLHPGLTPGFPNPTTTVPTGGTGVSWTNDPGFQDLFPVDPFTSEPAGTGYNAETDQSTAPDLYDLYGGWQ